MFFPWWTLNVSVMHRPTDIYPYLIDGPASEFVGYRQSPQMRILFDLLLACMILFAIGSFVKGKAISITTSAAAVLVGLAIWRFLVRVAGVGRLYNVPIQGHGVGDYGGFAFVDVYTIIQPGIYLALLSVVIGVIAGIFHKKLTNRFSLDWIGKNHTSDIKLSEEEDFFNNKNGGSRNED